MFPVGAGAVEELRGVFRRGRLNLGHASRLSRGGGRTRDGATAASRRHQSCYCQGSRSKSEKNYSNARKGRHITIHVGGESNRRSIAPQKTLIDSCEDRVPEGILRVLEGVLSLQYLHCRCHFC